MQKITQALKLLPTGAGSVFTFHFLLNEQWIQTVISGFITFVYSIWVNVSDEFKAEFKAEFIKALDPGGKGGQLGGWLGKIIGDIPQKVIKKLSGFKSKYKKALVDFYCDFETEGFKIGLPVLDLEDVFVPLKVETGNLENIDGAMVSSKRTGQNSENQEIWDFLAAISQQNSFRCMAVVAPPGYGKTTLLKHLTLTYAKNGHRKYKAPQFLPVLLYLRDIREEITSQQPPTLPELITKHLKNEAAFAELNPQTDWFNQQLKNGKCLVMLDGLDEVADSERSRVSEWVNQQMATYRQTAFIITSRPYGYSSAPVDKVGIILKVLPFTLEQMKQFINSWYLQTEIRNRAGKNNQAVKAKAENKAADLIDRIINNRAIANMATNPLLVTMIATVHYSNSALPGRRVELYQKICDLLLGTRQAAKKIKAPLTSEQNKSVLQVLALDLMQRETRTFEPAEVESLIAGELQTIVNTILTPGDFLEQIGDVSGLIVEREQGIFEFAHLSFQEYLAASQVKDLPQEKILIDNFDNPWWAETIRLYAAQSDATNLIESALKNQTVSSLTLAYDCLQESKKVKPQTQTELENILETGLASQDPKIAHIAAQVKLTRRLNGLLRINETQEIDQSYITWAEYEESIKGTFGINIIEQGFLPDDLNNIDPIQPVTGISFQAANRFCAWLSLNSNLDNNLIRYRLPTETEAKQYPAKDDKHLTCWTQENKNDGEGIRVVKDQWPPQYRQLLEHLAAGKWQEADEETDKMMLKVANREREGRLDVESIEKFPCSDLRTIDELWIQYSEGRFGFSVQKRIYEAQGKDWWKIIDALEWSSDGGSVKYNIKAPMGHLPKKWCGGSDGVNIWGTQAQLSQLSSSLAQRLVDCNL
ncbi:GUN4 domain-containing protein [Nodularia harveyana UHCC-0300]|uniref:GUN4 domain-containing protein n=1 Tax=Nodularia harveyana UHCC-0300 TaxID=2974287 RepID=A0ABU5UIC0_9CYAN|nr:GUN4 domain-containing protein [Nodularia harveyana]MEA5583219.1 GUN4 domain-containing protein [Nodularia harveyana UHCC-0300]